MLVIRLLCLEKQYCTVSQIEVDEVFRLWTRSVGPELEGMHRTMRHKAAKVSSYYAVPCRAFPRVKLNHQPCNNVILSHGNVLLS